jgi:Putative beta-barrel porin-2, OmpL-like. bbp2
MRKSLIAIAVLGTLGSALAYADEAPAADAAAAPAATAPAPIVLNGPGMNYPLVGAATPLNFDMGGPVGKVYVSGALTGMASTNDGRSKSSATASNPVTKNSVADITNAQVILQKIDGPVQFYIQAGGYSIPVIGQGYVRASHQTDDSYGLIPTAYVKLVPNDTFSFQVGKLPTLLGAEYTYTFENTNIQRGLLWNQENVFTRGVQANYAAGPLAASVQLTDGFYSKDYSWLTASVAYTINDSNSVSVVAGGNLGTTTYTNGYTTPGPESNGQVYNLIYKYVKGPLTVQPYLQYTYVPSQSGSDASALGYGKSTDTWGAAVLANYAVNDTVNIGARAEYITSSGPTSAGAGTTSTAANLLGYGVGSSAWSLTVTPTYQVKNYFVRGELSYVKVEDLKSGLGFGSLGKDDTQATAMIETGFLF